MKKKVLYIVSSLRSCGPINQLHGIVTNLDREKFTFKVLTLSPEPANSRMQEFLDSGIEVESLSLSRVQFMIRGKAEIKKAVNAYNPDVIHTTGVRVDSAVAKVGFGPIQVMSIRNYAYEDYVAKFGKLLGNYFAKDTIKAINKAKHPVCCSYALKDLYTSHVDKTLEVVQNGVNTLKYSPAKDDADKTALRVELGLPEDKVIYIAVGSLIKRKDPVNMIKAFKQADLSNAVFVLLGNGNLMDECKKEANNSVILKGNVSNVVDYLRASDIYISASYSEGLPNAVLEAGRTGVSLVLSDIPQHREVFMHGEKLPVLFEAGNVVDMTEGIRAVYQSIPNQEDNELSAYIKKYFSNQSMSEQYQDIYLEH